MRPFFARLLPFLFLGILIVIFAVGLIIFSYLLIFGALVGLVLFIVMSIKEWLFRKKNNYPTPTTKKGRTYDHK